MTVTKSVAEALGITPPLRFRGVTYHLAERTLEMEGAVEVHLQGLAREMILAQRDRMTAVEFAEQMAGWRREGPSAYAWDTPGCLQFAQSPRGLRLLALLQLKEGTPGEKVNERLVEEWFRDPEQGAVIAAAIVDSNFPFLASLLREAMQAPTTSLPTGITSAPDSPESPGSTGPARSENLAAASS